MFVIHVMHMFAIIFMGGFSMLMSVMYYCDTGGYYSVQLSPKLRLLCLNTALYYHSNNITMLTDAYDPSGQLSWLASQLEAAKLFHQKVLL